MPTCLEHWLTMAPTTCYGYKRRYHDIDTLKKQIIIHGKNAGIIIADNNDGPVLSMDDFIKVSPKILSRKRPRIEQPMAQTQDAVLVPMVQAQAQQPMADAVPVPMVQAQAQQPMADAAPVPMVQAQAQQPIANAAPVLMVQAQAQQPMAQVPMQEDEQLMEQALAQEVDAAPVPTVIFNGVHEPFVLNGLVIEVDPDTFMVNATQMCQAAGRLFGDYHRQKSTNEYLKALSSVMQNNITDLIKVNRGGDHSGTMVHRLIAYDLASWLSQDVKLRFYMRNDELRIENAALSTQIEELQANAADSTSTNAIAPPSAHLPNVNGVRRVVPTKTLVLNGLVIEVDPVTFMVNATQMCRAAGKLFGNYRRLDSTEDYLQGLSLDIHICISKLVQRNQSGRGLSQDTTVHFLVALHLAYWLSTEVQVQFSKWIGELLLTGRVELGNEMNVQQLEDVWRRRMQEGQDRASADLSAERERCQEIILQRNELEQRIVVMEEDKQISQAAKEALTAIKTREDLEAAIQFQVNTTAPRIATYKEGDNVLYLARIDETKFKYGHTKNLKQRIEAHRRPGVYPTLDLVWIVKSNNGVASEDQLHAYVKKKKIIAEYGTQREIILLESVDDLERMLKKMNRCALPRADADIDMRRMEIKIRKIEANAEIKMKKIKASLEMKMMQMLEEKNLTFEQYWQIKNLK